MNAHSPPLRRRFLTARWQNLILANFAVEEVLLTPHLPPGVELDRWQGRAYCSLVAFQFHQTRVLDVSWPGFRQFPEWNLRFYARRGPDRGVVFIREFVPQWLVCSVARLVYNEPYRPARLTEAIAETPDTLTAEYTVTRAGQTHTMRATGRKPARVPEAESVEHFFKEQQFGFGTSHTGRLLRYEVNHPMWAVYPVTEFHTTTDWGQLYGPAWAALTGRQPESVVLAAGSGVSVFPHWGRRGESG